MKKMKLKWVTIILLSITVNIPGYSQKNKNLQVNYLREGKLIKETISNNFINNKGQIASPYITSVTFSRLDSINYPDNNTDNGITFTTPIELNFTKKIKKYSPEYYTVYTLFNLHKAIQYYNKLFDNKIDFNSQEKYRNIEITFGNFPEYTTPNLYIIEKGSNLSPSIFFHEIGHRAFWLMEGKLNIKFKGLSYIHMGLLEYFTVSLTNSPVVGEDCLSPKELRNASWLYGYPAHDSLTLKYTMEIVKDSHPDQMKDPKSNVYKYYKASMEYDKNYMHIVDNHRGGMILTSTLWRIREQLGQEIMDKIVAQTILDLNIYMDQRDTFYKPEKNEKLSNRIDWYDVYYGLLQKDKELNNGKGKNIIKASFRKTGFPIDKVLA